MERADEGRCTGTSLGSFLGMFPEMMTLGCFWDSCLCLFISLRVLIPDLPPDPVWVWKPFYSLNSGVTPGSTPEASVYPGVTWNHSDLGPWILYQLALGSFS